MENGKWKMQNAKSKMQHTAHSTEQTAKSQNQRDPRSQVWDLPHAPFQKNKKIRTWKIPGMGKKEDKRPQKRTNFSM